MNKDKNPSELILESPNGKYQIVLSANDSCPGIWIQYSGDHAGKKGMIAIYLSDTQGPVVGVYGKLAEGETRGGLDAAFSADESGGHIQIMKPGKTREPDFLA